MELEFRGLIAPVFTCFKQDCNNSISYEEIPKYVQFLKDKGIKGILVNGTSGEGTSMNVEERKKVSEAWMKAAGKVMHVMIQVGGACLPDVLELAAHAENLGANSILCLPDLYIKPANSQDLENYLKYVSNSAPNTPLLYYHIPMFTNVNIHMGKFLNDISNRIPTFAGIKFTSNALDEGIEAVKAQNNRFAVFLGADTLMLSAYAAGFDSVIATTLNIKPELGINILNEFKKGNFEKAKHLQDNLSNIVSKITKLGPWVSSMKSVMNVVTPINCGPVRPPLPSIKLSKLEETVNSLKLDT